MLTSLFIEKAKILICQYTFLGYPFRNVSYLTESLTRDRSGACHYAKTDRRPVGIPEENETTFCDQTGSTKRNGSYTIFIPFSNSLP